MTTRQMALLPILVVLLLAAGAHASGGRQLQDAQAAAPSAAGMHTQQGMAPGPAPSEPMADILFTISAPRAVLTADALTLMDVASVVQFYTSESKAGVYSTGDFANSSAGGKFVTAAGQWLDHPMAVLKAANGSGNMTSALLSLGDPRYDAARHTLTFKTKIMPATRADGAVDGAVDGAEDGVGIMAGGESEGGWHGDERQTKLLAAASTIRA
ncbi:hypothetical protein WJX81_008402 [Elliptochloris bilobata]|uniref:Uncharacterized protein n=1 Tax=Elliptochloris bilobata TaxID=381761 RepID=A0AAW1QL00_9CHLO